MWLATRSATLRQTALAVDPEIVTFAYVDPGHQTDRELYSWGAAPWPLWDALRKKGRQVRAIGIGVENTTVDRAIECLKDGRRRSQGQAMKGRRRKQEIKAIRDAMKQKDRDVSSSLRRLRGSHEAAAVLYKCRSQDHGRSLD